MQHRVDPELRSEAGRFRLRYACRDCAHFDPPSGACAEGYPNAAHLDVDVETATTLEFCKSFELA